MDSCSAAPSVAVDLIPGRFGVALPDSSAIHTNRPRDEVAAATISFDECAIARSLLHPTRTAIVSSAAATRLFGTLNAVRAVENKTHLRTRSVWIISDCMDKYHSNDWRNNRAGR